MGRTIRQHLEDQFDFHSHEDKSPTHEKESVDYSKGNKDEHCGNCRHFEIIRPNGCELVIGKILPSMWCELWEIYEP